MIETNEKNEDFLKRPAQIHFKTKPQHNWILSSLAKCYGISVQNLFYDLVERASLRVLFHLDEKELEKMPLEHLINIRRFYFSIVEDSPAMKLGYGFVYIPTVPGKYFQVTAEGAAARANQADATLKDILDDRNYAGGI